MIQDSELSTNKLDCLSNLWRHLECPVCCDMPSPPISICIKGHHICNTCRAVPITSCPVCDSSFLDGRSFIAESLVRTVHLPCKYRIRGCKVLCVQTQKKIHESICPFAYYQCPLKKCRQMLDSKDTMLSHIWRFHSNCLVTGTITDGNVCSMFIGVDVPVHSSRAVFLRVNEWGLFQMKIQMPRSDDTMMYVIVQTIIATNEEDSFQYSCKLLGGVDKEFSKYSFHVQSFRIPEEMQLNGFNVSFMFPRNIPIVDKFYRPQFDVTIEKI